MTFPQFRVYIPYIDDPAERMCYENRYALLPNGTLMMDCGDDGWEEMYSVADDDVHVMRCTDMEDNAGKLIYEDDVVDIYDWGGESQEILHRARIVWDVDEKGWGYRPFFNVDRYDAFRNIKVVGNVYENPELLKSVS